MKSQSEMNSFPSYRSVPPSGAPPLTARKQLPRFPLLLPYTGRWPPANTMCLAISTYCAHKTMKLHTMTRSTMFTNNFCACQSFPFTNIRLIWGLHSLKFWRVLTAAWQQCGCPTQIRNSTSMVFDRGVWWKRTFWAALGSGNDVD